MGREGVQLIAEPLFLIKFKFQILPNIISHYKWIKCFFIVFNDRY